MHYLNNLGRKSKIRHVMSLGLALVIILLSMTVISPFTFAEEAETDAAKIAESIEAENAYALRMQYSQDLIMQNVYDARMEYASVLEENYSIRNRVVDYALSWVGVTPYVWAGGSLIYGTDCSGFVRLIFQEFGYDLPSGSDAYQWAVGYHVSAEEMLPGDIIVYDNGAHVGIYAGNGFVVHCSSPENGTVCWGMWYRPVTAIVRVLD